MDLVKVKEYLQEIGEPGFRIKQIEKNYYTGKAKNFDEMTDLSKDLRTKLSEKFSLLSVESEQIFTEGHTQKALLKLEDGHKIESVLMDYENWLTVCISSQVGCALNCQFCATGKMGFVRNLTPSELVDQILFWNKTLFPKYVGRVVLMGMGEPFLNWDNVLEAIKIINSPNGLNIGARKISVSTAGVVDKIKAFADLGTQINLAISLHSINQETREKIMPIAKKYSLSELKNACNYFVGKTNRQLFFEYALMHGINDSADDARQLATFIQSNRLFYLNVIPLNAVTNGLEPSTPRDFDNFVKILESKHVEFTIRRSFGQNLNAACGQLALKNPCSQE